MATFLTFIQQEKIGSCLCSGEDGRDVCVSYGRMSHDSISRTRESKVIAPRDHSGRKASWKRSRSPTLARLEVGEAGPGILESQEEFVIHLWMWRQTLLPPWVQQEEGEAQEEVSKVLTLRKEEK